MLSQQVGEAFLYIGSAGKHVFKLQLEAGRPSQAWSLATDGGVGAAVRVVPAAVPGEVGHVVFTSSNGEVWAVSERDGRATWKFNATAPNGTSLNTMLRSEPLLYKPLGGRPLVIVTGSGSCRNCSGIRPDDPVAHTVFGLDASKVSNSSDRTPYSCPPML